MPTRCPGRCSTVQGRFSRSRSATLRLVAVLAIVLAAALSAGPAIAADPGPHPVPCGAGPCDQDGSAGPHVMRESSVIHLSISPHVAHPGQIIHMDITYSGTGHCLTKQGPP
jgi:hypothetical protein